MILLFRSQVRKFEIISCIVFRMQKPFFSPKNPSKRFSDWSDVVSYNTRRSPPTDDLVIRVASFDDGVILALVFVINDALNFFKGTKMNWDIIEGNWKQLKGKFKSQWGKLTDEHLDEINGQREILVGKIQEGYGLSKEEAEKQINDFESGNKDLFS